MTLSLHPDVTLAPRAMPALRRHVVARERERLGTSGALDLFGDFVVHNMPRARMFYGTPDFTTLVSGAWPAYSSALASGIEMPSDFGGLLYLQTPLHHNGYASRGVLWMKADDTTPGVGRGNILSFALLGEDETVNHSCAYTDDPVIIDKIRKKHAPRPYHYLEGGDALMLGDPEVFQIGMSAVSLLDQPNLIETERVSGRVTKGRDRKRAKFRADDVDPVSIVHLRRTISRRLADVEGAERTYSHRWIVRGHWRNQAVGEGRQERRSTYVAPHVKGPADAPLVARERVYVW